MRHYGLYIHIPFCVSKCLYCDFLSYANCSGNLMREYTSALVDEINRIKKSAHIFDTVYIGGGTPTALPPLFLFETINAVNGLNIMPDAEFTVEMNPGTVGGDASGFFSDLLSRGVNRLSIGLQSRRDALLKTIGRIHTAEDFDAGFSAARNAGFANISVDVMFALPGQSFEMWMETLRDVARLSPEHVSAYSLTPEEGTPLWYKLENRELVLPGDDADREMYHAAKKFLAVEGYEHYEISNFARPGFEGKHNSRYWTRAPYLGAGLGASSFDGHSRWRNTCDMEKYIAENGNAPREDSETISARAALAEEMFLGLRLLRGVPYNAFFAKETDELVRRGLLEETGGLVRLTELGLDLANRVFAEFSEG